MEYESRIYYKVSIIILIGTAVIFGPLNIIS